MLRVYVSSTYLDLVRYRQTVIEALRRMGHHVVSMEDYGAADERPLERCLQDVEACDVYVGIFAWRYGFIPTEGNPDRKSITELEYRQALRSGKKCLIFLLHEDQPWPPGAVDHGPPRDRLDQLRKELTLRHVVAYYRDEGELATLVVTALHKTAVAGGSPPHGPSPALTTAPSSTKPFGMKFAGGQYVWKMCDRRSQETRFREFVKDNLVSRPGIPHVFITCGERHDCHASLVDRLLWGLQPIVEKRWGSDRGVIGRLPAEGSLGWPYHDSLPQLQLLHDLFREVDASHYDDYSPKAFAGLVARLGNPVFAVQHIIHAERWHASVRHLLPRYLEFWSELAEVRAGSQFMVFLNFWYPEAPRTNWWRPRFLGRSWDRERFLNDLHGFARNWENRLPCLVLDELGPLQKHDVDEWFNRFYTGDRKTSDELAAQLFPRPDACLTMATIEHHLRTIHERYLEEQTRACR